jgi:hypothetical protein
MRTCQRGLRHWATGAAQPEARHSRPNCKTLRLLWLRRCSAWVSRLRCYSVQLARPLHRQRRSGASAERGPSGTRNRPPNHREAVSFWGIIWYVFGSKNCQKVGAGRFELPTPCTPCRCASRATLRPGTNVIITAPHTFINLKSSAGCRRKAALSNRPALSASSVSVRRWLTGAGTPRSAP